MFTSSTFLFVYGTLLLAYMVIKRQCVSDHNYMSTDSNDLQKVAAVMTKAAHSREASHYGEAPRTIEESALDTTLESPSEPPESKGNSKEKTKEKLTIILNTLSTPESDSCLISAIKEAGKMKITESIHLLGALLDHCNPSVCEASARSLGHIGDPRALEFLFSSTDKLESEILKLDSTEHIQPAEQIIHTEHPVIHAENPGNTEKFTSSKETHQEEQLDSINHGIPSNIPRPSESEQVTRGKVLNPPPLDRILPPLRENNFKVLDRRTPYNLNKLNEDQMTELLLKISIDEDEQTSHRYYAIKNLAYFPRKNLAGEAAVLFGSPEPAIRFAAADTVARIGGKEASNELIKALHDENPYVRSSAASGLATLGDDRSLAPLLKLKNDKDEIVRFSAERALNTLSEKKDIAPLINSLLRNNNLSGNT